LLFQVTDGRPPYTWSELGGAALGTISCNEEGSNNEFFRCNSGASVLTGTTSTLDVDVTDFGSSALAALTEGNDDQGHSGHTITVQDVLAITSISPLDSAVDGSAYASMLLGSGGLAASHAWTETAGAGFANDPGGDCGTLALSLAGAITGTPAIVTDNSCDFSVDLNDAGNDTTPDSTAASGTASAALSIPVAPTGSPIITNDVLINGLAGFSYSQSFVSSGGAGPDDWIAPGNSGTDCPTVGGALPTGTALGMTTGILGGTSDPAGTFIFGVCVEDNAGFDLKNFTVVINDALVYVTENTTDGIFTIDTTTDTVGTEFTAGASPLGVDLSPGGTRAYVANPGDDTVSVIDTTTAPPSVVATVSVGSQPRRLAVAPDGSKVYVANNGTETISVISTATNTVSTTITITGKVPFDVTFLPDGSFAYVSDSSSGEIHKINAATDALNSTITAAGGGLQGIVAHSDGRFVYAVDSTGSEVHVVDTSSDTFIDFDGGTGGIQGIAVGTGPIGLDITPDGKKLYVANNTSGNVSVIDTDSASANFHTVIATITAGGSPRDVAVTPDGAKAYVTLDNAGGPGPGVDVIATSTDTVSTKVSTGFSGLPQDNDTVPYPVLHFATGTTLPDATATNAYAASVVALGGTGALSAVESSASADCSDFTFTQSGGAIIITGTPAAAGTCTFDVDVTDSATVTQLITDNFSITIN